MKNKVTTIEKIMPVFKDGMTIMIGGFGNVGVPETLLDALIKSNVQDLTIITNDGGYYSLGIGRLINTRQVRTFIGSHMGGNKYLSEQINEGWLKWIMVPQGSLVEKIRCGGAGLGGALTKTGLGTEIADGKQIITINGEDWLLEEPLHADLALLRGAKVDTFGNAILKGTQKSFSTVMAAAADHVIMAAEEIVPVGEIGPEEISISGIFVDEVVGGEEVCILEDKMIIKRR